MKKNLLSLAGLAALALGLGSCAYDPFYGGGGHSRTSVSVGYGDGFGYGGNSFTTSHFWTTGNSRWGYDPYVRSYYDYHRRCYYDPFLHGYYPIGYRPPILVGVPHPVGYRRGWCPPPSRITNVTIVNYRNRESAYRNTNHSWARNVRFDNRQRAMNGGFQGRDSGRNATRSGNGFINTPGRDSVGGFDGRRNDVNRRGGDSNWQRRGADPRTSIGPQAVRQRQEIERNTRFTPSPRVERGQREWNGRGNNARTLETPPPMDRGAQRFGRDAQRMERGVPDTERGGGAWGGRQQRPESASPAPTGPPVRQGGFDGGRGNVRPPAELRGRGQQGVTSGESGSRAGFEGRSRDRFNRGGRE